MYKNGFSIQTKIFVSITVIFILVIGVSTWQNLNSERQLVEDFAIQKARDIAASYFDALNTMMLTNTLQESEVLRNKTLSNPEVSELRVIRAKGITDFFGAGKPEQSAQDTLDQRALGGEAVQVKDEDDSGRIVTVVEPILANSNFRGTNCLSCHPVRENTVLGAVRVTYSLASQDSSINKRFMISLMINSLMLITGFIVLTWLMRRFVISPITQMQSTMQVIEKDSDLTLRLNIPGNDEMAKLADAFNTMLKTFSDSLGRVSESSGQLSSAASKILSAAEKTSHAAIEQQSETNQVIDAITELENTVTNVRSNAVLASEASVEADQSATSGARTTREAIDGIYGLVKDIENAAEVIVTLDEQSKGVGSVLDVIRGIAEQTNLLALNAAIEAARAGNQGRGFAVVADEVRSLATKSHQSTEEIEKIIARLQLEAKRAVDVMTKAKISAEERQSQVHSADEELNKIADRVTHIRDLNQLVMSATDDQSIFAENVNCSIGNISKLVAGTAEDAKQTNEASLRLVELVHELNQLVDCFKR